MFICGYYTQRRPTRSKYVLNVSFGLVNLRPRVLPMSNGKHTLVVSGGSFTRCDVCIVTTALCCLTTVFLFSFVLPPPPAVLRTRYGSSDSMCMSFWWHDFGWGSWFSFYNNIRLPQLGIPLQIYYRELQMSKGTPTCLSGQLQCVEDFRREGGKWGVGLLASSWRHTFEADAPARHHGPVVEAVAALHTWYMF